VPVVKIQPRYRRGAARYDRPINLDGYSEAGATMANEVLAKVCHNVAIYELGIDPGFGGAKREDPSDASQTWLVRFPGAQCMVWTILR